MAAAGAGGLAISEILRNLPRAATKVALTPVIEKVLNDPGSPSAGAANPDVTVVLFTDYQCPVCKATDPALERLLRADSKVRVIFKDWPIFGARSRAAARAALAAARQGKYLALHQGLMDARVELDGPQLRRIAASVGIDQRQLADDEARFRAALDAQLGKHAMQAWSLGLAGAPAYLVGPYLYQGGLDETHLAQAVRRGRRAGPPV